MPLPFQPAHAYLPDLPQEYLSALRHHLLPAAYHPPRGRNPAPPAGRPREVDHLAQNRGSRVAAQAVRAEAGVHPEEGRQNAAASGGQFPAPPADAP